MSKVCSKCKVEKDENEFYNNKRTPDGLDYYCKDCRRLSNNPIREISRRAGLKVTLGGTADETRAFVESLKTECCKCGEDRPWVIQFHHVNPEEKLFNIGTYGTRSRSSIWREVSKCVCLCSNCHDEFHHFFGSRPENPVQSLDDYLNDQRY